MTYEAIVQELKNIYKDASFDQKDTHAAIEINLSGEGGGALYLEIINGNVNIEPYEYYNNHASIISSAEVFLSIASGTKDVQTALSNGELTVHGDLESVLLIEKINKKAPVVEATPEVEEAPVVEAAPVVKETKTKAPCKKTTTKTSSKKSTAKTTKKTSKKR